MVPTMAQRKARKEGIPGFDIVKPDNLVPHVQTW